MNKSFSLSLVLVTSLGSAAVAGGAECNHSGDDAAMWTYDAISPENLCRVIVAADASAVAARCGRNLGASADVSDDLFGFALTKGAENAGYYAGSTATFTPDQIAPDMTNLLERAQTCLATDTCKTGPNPPAIVDLLAAPNVPTGHISLDVADNPNVENDGLFGGAGLGAGLGSALEGNPPLDLNFIMIGDTPARTWQDPSAMGGLPSFNIQILEAETDTCPK